MAYLRMAKAFRSGDEEMFSSRKIWTVDTGPLDSSKQWQSGGPLKGPSG